MRIADFMVRDAFVLEERNLFVVAGELISGNPRPGLVATLDDESTGRFQHPIHGVEFVDGTGPEKATYPALTFSYTSSDERDAWTILPWVGATLHIDTA